MRISDHHRAGLNVASLECTRSRPWGQRASQRCCAAVDRRALRDLRVLVRPSQICTPAAKRSDVLCTCHGVSFTQETAHLRVIGEQQLADAQRRWNLRNKAAEARCGHPPDFNLNGSAALSDADEAGTVRWAARQSIESIRGAVTVRSDNMAPRSSSW